jgi:hypothetical protein
MRGENDMTDQETCQEALNLAIIDLLTAAQDAFAIRLDLVELTIERRGGGTAWLALDGRLWALPKGADQ